ncbi:MAG: MFS transporter [Actinobacteria bacterium]|nr:MFS transporter [Actinomycetota bacterium]
MTIGLVLLVTLIAFEALAVNTALPAASRELGALGLYGWVFAAFMLSTVASIALSGKLIDERGLYSVLAAGVPLFCLGLAIGAAAPSMLALVGARVVQGLGAGAISSVANVAIGRAYPPKLRAAMLAVMSSAWVVPGLIGPGLAAVITTSFGWRWVFAGLIPIVAVAAILTMPALRPFGPITVEADDDDTRRAADPLLVAAGFAFVIGGFSNANDVWPLVFVVVGLGIAVPALRRLSPMGTFRLRRGRAAAIALNGVMSCAFFAVDAFVPLAVTEVRHRSVGFAGFALTTGAISWTLGAWLTARINTRVDVRTRVRGGFGLVAIGIMMVLLGLRQDVPIGIFPAAWFVAGLGMGLGYQGLALVVLGGGDGEHDSGPPAAVVAARQMFDTLGNAIGTGVAGACVAVTLALGDDTKVGLIVAFVTMISLAMFGAAASGRAAELPAPADAPSAALP